jgi:hypothetical protein
VDSTDEERVERVPVLQVLKRQPKEVALTALLRLPEQAPGYIFGAFIFTYGTTVLGASRNFLLIGVLVSAVLGFLWVKRVAFDDVGLRLRHRRVSGVSRPKWVWMRHIGGLIPSFSA